MLQDHFSKSSPIVGCYQFIGIGNRRRIRFLRLRTQKFMLNAGSHTTQRLKGADGKNIAHPMIREPRDV
jgi:hypothetical protein